jgi:ABC-2 type transport system ATP-binding protein
MIILENIKYEYPKKKSFQLSIPYLSIHPGEIFTLLGQNGAGKTTLIRIISGLILPQSGNVKIFGENRSTGQLHMQTQIGLVMGEERSFYYRLTGTQNLEFFGGLRGLKRAYLKSRIPELLNTVGLSQDGKLQYMRYSSGMKKRLNLARALLHNPKVLLLDEPNSGIDPKSSKTIREIVLDLKNKGHVILLTTHNMDEAERMSDRIGFLKEGNLIKIGTLEDYKKLIEGTRLEIKFRKAPGNDDLPAIGDIINQIKAITMNDSVVFNNNTLKVIFNGSLDLNHILSIVTQSGFAMDKSNTLDASLEDIFIKLAE